MYFAWPTEARFGGYAKHSEYTWRRRLGLLASCAGDRKNYEKSASNTRKVVTKVVTVDNLRTTALGDGRPQSVTRKDVRW